MQEAIGVVAIGCAVLSFLVYLAITFNVVTPGGQKKVEESLEAAVGPVKGITPPSAKDVAEILKALASLAESLVKAGPALWSLIGSALFLLIACLAAWVFSGSSDASPDVETPNEINSIQDKVAATDENLTAANDTSDR